MPSHPWLSLRVILGIALQTISIACSSHPSVTIPQGIINGFKDQHNNSIYLGIPFAQTTGDENRWLPTPPLPLPPSIHTLNATSYGPTCPQAITNSYFSRQDEDCLNLNIWAPPAEGRNTSGDPTNGSPAFGGNFPVFVYMYGGAMVTGSNSNPQIQGTNFATNGVVYVNFNTRESLWASPNSAELGGVQNFGMLDVEAAMEWVRGNIAAFGGNASHIIFGGHSSGSVQVDHYLWRHPDTWLAGAVEMSANALSGPAYAPTNVALDLVAAEVGCPLSKQTSWSNNTIQGSGQTQLTCLRNTTTYELQTTTFNSTYNTWFSPTIDNLTRFPSSSFNTRPWPSHVPLLTGNSANEGRIFANIYRFENSNFSHWIQSFDADSSHIPSHLLLSAYQHNNTNDSLVSGTQYGDARFNCPVDHFLTSRSSVQQTWVYRFFGAYDNVVGVAGTAPTHGTEVPFFHGGGVCFDTLENVTVAQQELADSIHGWFVKWIKDPKAGPGWVQFRAEGDDGGEVVAKIGVPGRELEVIEGDRKEWNEVCKEVYEEFWGEYPRVQSPV